MAESGLGLCWRLRPSPDALPSCGPFATPGPVPVHRSPSLPVEFGVGRNLGSGGCGPWRDPAARAASRPRHHRGFRTASCTPSGIPRRAELRRHPPRPPVTTEFSVPSKRPRYQSGLRRPRPGFDVTANYYADPGAQVCSESDHVIFQRGTKTTGIDTILRRDPELLLAYDHVLFLDDDIALSAEDIGCFFVAMEQHDLALAQPLRVPIRTASGLSSRSQDMQGA